MPSLAVKNLRTSLDVVKQSFLFSGDSTWLLHDKGLCHIALYVLGQGLDYLLFSQINLLVSHMGHRISWIEKTLDLFIRVG